MTARTVSVLVTVYNREDYLEKTLHSILTSTYSDFEIIVVDDCSTDSSAAIAAGIAKEDHRIRFVQNQQNLGDYANRMKAASLAVGKYLKYVDSDDLIYPHTLDVMVRAMDANADAAVGLAHSTPEEEEPYPWKLSSQGAWHKHFLGRGCLSCGPTGAIIRRDAFEAVNGFRKEWGVLSDTELWLRLATQHPVVLLPPGLVWWRRHEGQEFTRGDAAEVYLSRGHELDILTLHSENCPLSDRDQSLAMAKRKQHYARRLWSFAVRYRRISLAVRLYRKSHLGLADLIRGLSPYR